MQIITKKVDIDLKKQHFRNKKGFFIMIKSSICQEFLMILNSYASNNMALNKYSKFQNNLHGKTNSQSFWKIPLSNW